VSALQLCQEGEKDLSVCVIEKGSQVGEQMCLKLEPAMSYIPKAKQAGPDTVPHRLWKVLFCPCYANICLPSMCLSCCRIQSFPSYLNPLPPCAHQQATKYSQAVCLSLGHLTSFSWQLGFGTVARTSLGQ
jgi:hypothetical protein